MMATWDILFWLILGLLIGWVALWGCDKLFLRDGMVAGMRAEREASAIRSELEGTRERLVRTEGLSETLKTDLLAHNDQADILRTELAMMRNEQTAVHTDLAAAKDKHRIQLQEVESSRKLAAERASEIESLEKRIAELEGERDKAQRWANGREAEAGELMQTNATLQSELASANKLLASSGRQIDFAQRQARSIHARLATGKRVPARDQGRLTGRMKRLSVVQNTIDALADADAARRRASVAARDDDQSSDDGDAS